MKIALVHDYLREAGGAERVLRVLAEMYPGAPIYTAFARRGTARQMLADRKIVESKWAPLLKIGRLHSYLRFLLPSFWGGMDLSSYDLVITSSSGYIARGFGVGDKTRVIAYCHTPPKWLYGYETPTGAGALWWGQTFMWVVGPFLRYFDYKSAQRVDIWIANSQEVAARVAKFYRKRAIVVYPPVEVRARANSKQQLATREDYYLVVSRIVGAKGIGAAVEGARRAGVRLKVVGEMIGKQQLAISKQEGVEYLGRVGDEELTGLYAHARGFIALARDEDFGMSVVEAMGQGTPVLALDSGGYKETVREGMTGVLIGDTKPEAVAEGIALLARTKWDRVAIAKWARRFGRARFERSIRRIVGA